jgi:SAM-dependent methyltransferase
VITEMAPAEQRFSRPDHYSHIGRAALRDVRLAMLAAGKDTVTSVLDMPCGHGRVLRVLKAAFPDARLTACDIDPDAVDFCAQVFGAHPVYSEYDPAEVEIGDSFDLLWCGSLLTHLPRARWHDFLALFESVLAPRGLLVFTVHGRYVADRLRGAGRTAFERSYGLPPDRVASLLAAYDREGFGFSAYPQQEGYGISLSSPPAVCEALSLRTGLRLVGYREEWHDMARPLDVIACVRDVS